MPVELHASSAFSFLRGSSLPEELVARAAELELKALALLDRDGLSGAPRFFKAARQAGMRPIVGAELSLFGGGALPVLAESLIGYRNLCRLITTMKAGVAKGKGVVRLEGLQNAGWEGPLKGLVALPGVMTLGEKPDPDRLAHVLRAFGAENVAMDVQRHRRRAQEAANQALLDLADALGLPRRGHRRRAPRPRARPRAARRPHLHPREADAGRRPGACWPRTRSAT